MSDQGPPKKNGCFKIGCISIIGIVLLAWVIGALGHGSSSDNSSSGSADNNSSSTQSSDTSSNAPIACCTATIGGMRYEINGITRTTSIGDNEFNSHTAAGEYILVSVKISNVGDQSATVDDQNFHLKNDSNKSFDVDGSVGMDVPGEWELTTLNPGLTKSGKLIFEVPANTSPAKYALQVFGNGSTDSTLVRL